MIKSILMILLAILLGFGLIAIGIILFAGGIDEVKSWKDLQAECQPWTKIDTATKKCVRICADNLFYNKEGKCEACPAWTSYSSEDNKCVQKCSNKLLYVPDGQQTSTYSCKSCKEWTNLESSTNKCVRTCASDSVLNL